MNSKIGNREKILKLRELMPATTNVHYLNNGTNGPIPQKVFEAMRAEADKEFYEGRYLPFMKELYEEMDQTRKLIAKIIGASFEEVALTQSTTEALNIVLWGIRWRVGDEVITTDIDHTSVLAPLAQVKSRNGITVKYVSVAYGEAYEEEVFLQKVRNMITPRTRMLIIPHVSFATGMTFPVEKLAKMCHENDVMILVDGAQGVGAIPTNVANMDVDFYAMAGRKWLLGPEGVGALYIAKDRISEVDPTFICPSSVKDRHSIDIHSPYFIPAPYAARYHTATAMYSPVLIGFKTALEFFINEVGIEWATDRIPKLAKHVRNLISEIPGVEIVTPEGTEAGFIHFLVKGWEPAELCQILNDNKFMVRPVPKQHVPAPIRISTGFYVTEEELELFAKTLKDIISS